MHAESDGMAEAYSSRLPRVELVLSRFRALLPDAPAPVMQPGNPSLTRTYWEVGRALAEVGATDARLVRALSERLTAELGPGLAVPTLRFLRDLYAAFPDPDALPPGLTLRHCRLLVPIPGDERRAYYATECARHGWTPKGLKEAIAACWYERFGPSPEEEARAWARIAQIDPDGALVGAAWERALFYHLADAYLPFLTDEYGMRIDPEGAYLIEQHKADGPAYGYLYRNAMTAVMVAICEYYTLVFFAVTVWKLEGGLLYADEARLAEVPYLERRQVGDGLGLSLFIARLAPDLVPTGRDPTDNANLFELPGFGPIHPLDRVLQARLLERNFALAATALRRCCDDALRGDFATFDRVRAAVYARRD